MKFKIADIEANPFRHIDRYPIREDKITALRESISTTGFWDNIVGRQVGDHVQIAYGHHRREALRREYSGDHEVGIVVRDFSDDDMLKIMARENMEEWGSSAQVEIETVRAVVEAYGAEQIKLGEVSSQARGVRNAPSFAPDFAGRVGALRPYTARTVAEFLGWLQPSGEVQDKVHNALSALAYIEDPSVPLLDSDFFGLTTKQAEALVEETRRLLLAQKRKAEAEAKRAAELETQRKAATERAERAAAERAAALERAKAAREQADKDRAEQEYLQQHERAEQADRDRREADRRAEAQRRENLRSERARTAQREQSARQMGADLRRPGAGISDARANAAKARKQYSDGPDLRDLGRTVRSLASRFGSFFTNHDLGKGLDEVLGLRQHIAESDRQQLVAGLEEMRDHITRRLETIGGTNATGPVVVFDGSDVIDAEIVDA